MLSTHYHLQNLPRHPPRTPFIRSRKLAKTGLLPLVKRLWILQPLDRWVILTTINARSLAYFSTSSESTDWASTRSLRRPSYTSATSRRHSDLLPFDNRRAPAANSYAFSDCSQTLTI